MEPHVSFLAMNALAQDGEVSRRRLVRHEKSAGRDKADSLILTSQALRGASWTTGIGLPASSLRVARSLALRMPAVIAESDALGARLLPALIDSRCPADRFMTEFIIGVELTSPMRIFGGSLRVCSVDRDTTDDEASTGAKVLWTWWYAERGPRGLAMSMERSELMSRSAWARELEEIEARIQPLADGLFGAARNRIMR